MILICPYCGKTDNHTVVDPKLDPTDAWKYNDANYIFSLRGIKPEYWTVKCPNCKSIRTIDFAKD